MNQTVQTIIYIFLISCIAGTITASDIGKNVLSWWAGMWCSNKNCTYKVKNATKSALSLTAFVAGVYAVHQVWVGKPLF